VKEAPGGTSLLLNSIHQFYNHNKPNDAERNVLEVQELRNDNQLDAKLLFKVCKVLQLQFIYLNWKDFRTRYTLEDEYILTNGCMKLELVSAASTSDSKLDRPIRSLEARHVIVFCS